MRLDAGEARGDNIGQRDDPHREFEAQCRRKGKARTLVQLRDA